jgi:acyl-CoA hydrolase
MTPEQTRTEMTWIVMPGQVNALGTAFGGQVLAWIDICAAVSAQRFARTDVVTAAMDSIEFTAPIHKGDIVVLLGMVNRGWRTSMEVGVRVEAEHPHTGHRRHAATAYVTFVSVDANGKPSPVPTLHADTERSVTRAAAADERRQQRLAARTRR